MASEDVILNRLHRYQKVKKFLFLDHFFCFLQTYQITLQKKYLFSKRDGDQPEKNTIILHSQRVIYACFIAS